MSLVIVKLTIGPARIAMIAAVVLCLLAAWFSLKWNFANMIAERLEPDKPETRVVADWLATVSPSDPRTHAAAALAFERSFDMGDVTRAVAEYEAATALSPENFFNWLSVGRSRGLNGDAAGAVTAYGRALQLAPNYASVQWAYGNALVRRGQLDEGFPFMAKAAEANSDYSQPAAITALQILDGNADAARRSLGESDAVTAALAGALASQQRFEEAVALWAKLPVEKRSAEVAKIGDVIRDQLLKAKQFRLAARLAVDGLPAENKPVVGRITNAGFESEVKTRNSSLFEWQIGEGAHPQIGLAEGQAFAGRSNLFLLFNSFESSAFRTVSQTVAVEPNAEYELSFHYRSDLKPPVALKFEAVNACDLAVIASTAQMSPTADWTEVSVRFRAASDCDAVIIRLNRDGCAGPTCPMSGKLSLDEFSLKLF